MRNVVLKYPETEASRTSENNDCNLEQEPETETAEAANAIPITPTQSPTDMTSTCATESDTPNLGHAFVRDDHLKNDGLPMTHSPNAINENTSPC